MQLMETEEILIHAWFDFSHSVDDSFTKYDRLSNTYSDTVGENGNTWENSQSVTLLNS